MEEKEEQREFKQLELQFLEVWAVTHIALQRGKPMTFKRKERICCFYPQPNTKCGKTFTRKQEAIKHLKSHANMTSKFKESKEVLITIIYCNRL